MSTPNPFVFNGSDLQKIQAYQWPASGTPRACVQIVHGMGEHALRYSAFAEFLNLQGITVYANDHRGHGQTATDKTALGYFADNDGWALCIRDLSILTGIIKENHPGLPVIMLGHSMGSFMGRSYIIQYPDRLSGIILSGTGTHSPLLIFAGKSLTQIQRLFMGKKHRNQTVHQMSFGAFNKRIQNPRTAYDWLTRDEKIVDQYIADDYCGFVCTTGFFSDLFDGLKMINDARQIRKVRPDLPVLLASGEEDPVGNYSKGVKQAAEKFRRAGIADLTMKFYPGARHEIINEINRDEVWNDLLHWINTNIDKQQK